MGEHRLVPPFEAALPFCRQALKAALQCDTDMYSAGAATAGGMSAAGAQSSCCRRRIRVQGFGVI